MASALTVNVALVGMVTLALLVLGTVHRRERFWFVPGVVLVIAGLTFLSDLAAGLVAFVGLLAVFASTVPMLRE